jgi:hypothetical protein
MEAIDFDAASNAWRANKKSLPNGMFAYKCVHIHSTGRPCNNRTESEMTGHKYATHPYWTTTTSSSSASKQPWKYCKKHRSKGLGLD